MKNILTALLLAISAASAFSQITFKIELLPDNATYRVSMISDATWTFPQNLTASGQVTLRVPHGFGGNSFQVSNLTMLTPNADWDDNSRINSPVEAPSWDYISFGLISFGTAAYNYQTGAELPMFSFQNGSPHCADSIELINNLTDPFLPPNSVGANIGNALVTFGGGLINAYNSNFGSGKVPCTPGVICEVSEVLTIKLCNGDSYQDSIYTQSTFLDDHFTTADGCDSIIGTAILVGNSTYINMDTAICQGALFNGLPVQQDEMWTTTLTNFQGCDSVVTFFVDMIEPAFSTSSITLLPGQILNGTAWFSDTTVIFPATAASGCDSFASVQISIYQVPVTNLTAHRCEGEPFNGIIYSQSISLLDTLTGAQGFDSLVLTNLFVHPVYLFEQTIPLCAGESFNGIIYPADVTLTQNLSTVFGCDSTYITHLDVQIPTTISLDTVICLGQTFLGFPLQNDTLLTTVVPSAAGCDSLIFVANVQVAPLPTASISGEKTLCAGETATLTASGGASFTWSNGATTGSIEVSGTGIFSVVVANAEGCEDEATASVSASNISAEILANPPGCAVGSDGSIVFSNVSGGVLPYAFSIDGGNLFTTKPHFTNLFPGTYETVIEDQNGCEWRNLATVAEPNIFLLELGEDQNISLGEHVSLKAETNLSQPALVQWSPAFGLSCTDCLEPVATPFETTTYRLTLTDSAGCSQRSKIQIVVRTERQIFVPTAFSPNDDGVNDLLFVFAGQDAKLVRRFVIFDRWGEQLFSSENTSWNDPATGWDGSFKGKPVPVGMYSWRAEVEFVDGVVEVFSGGLAVMK